MTARPEGADLVPVALARLASLGWRLLAVLAFAIAVAYLTVILSTVVASVLVAVVISATFSPYLITMRERGRSRTASAALVTVGALAVILGIVLLVALAFLPYLVDLGKAVVGGLSSISDFLGTLPLPADIKAFLAAIGTAITQDITAIASSIASTAATLVTIGILGGILTFFLLQDGDRAWVWALGSWSSWRQEAITSSGRVALDRVGGYLRRSGVQSGISAISGFVFLALLGVPFPGPLAVFVFFGGFIPYFGGIITTTVLALVALGTVGTAKTVLLLVLIVGVNLVQRRWVEPRIRGEALDIHPALLLVVLPLGYALGGLVGLFISVPVLAFVLAVGGALVTVLDDEPGGEPERAEVIPVWLDRLAQWSWRLLVAIGLLAVLVIALVRIPIVVVPVGAAIIAAATLHPADVALRKRGLSPGRSALVATLGAAVAITAILFLTVYSLAGPIQQLIDSAVSGAESSDGAADGMLGMLVDFVRSVGQGLVPAVLDIARAVVGLAFVVIISGLLTFFFIRDGSTLWGRLTRPLAAHRRRHLDAAGDASVRVLGGYMIATGVISAFGAATQFVIMAILGIPLALPLAILSFFGGFIPYVGSFVTTGLAFLVTVSTGNTTDIIIMFIFTIVFNIVQGNVVAPIVYGRAVSLHPAIILIAIPAGAALAGIAGMFLIVPVIGVIAATWSSLLLSLDDSAEAAPAGGPDPATVGPSSTADEAAAPLGMTGEAQP